MRDIRFSKSIPVVVLSLVLAAVASAQEPEGVELRGVVHTVDGSGARVLVAGAKVEIQSPVYSAEAACDGRGGFVFRGVPSATAYRIEAHAPGLAGSIDITAGDTGAEVDFEVRGETRRDSVTVNGSTEPAAADDSSTRTTVSRETVLNAPNKRDQIDALLPLVPGVVRGPDGLLNMKGGRSSQGAYLVNSANVTDPVTGDQALRLPIDVVESVAVIANPYDPEYGRLTGAVASLQTVDSNFDSFHIGVQNLLVRPRRRDGDFVGIEAATPRITFTGPIIKHKVAFTESFEYRFIRTPVESLPQLQRDQKLEGFNSYSQLDVNLTERQSLTVAFALYPQKLNYVGLDTFNPQDSTPDVHQRGYLVSLQHRYLPTTDSVIISQVSYKSFDADVTPNSTAAYQLGIEGASGGYFDRQSRRSERTQWQETWQLTKKTLLGSHELKAGTDYAHSGYEGRVEFSPVTVMGTTDIPVETVTFGPAAHFGISENELAWFLADKWTPVDRVTLDLGVRFDRDSLTDSVNTAPRLGFAIRLTKDAKTLLRGGAGLFYDRVPLNLASFPFLPSRTVTTFDEFGTPTGSTSYANEITARLRNPRSTGWNVELGREVTKTLTVRAAYQQRDTSREFVVNPERAAQVLSLSNSGFSQYQEFQVSGRYRTKKAVINASYVRSRAWGDLNDFSQFFGNDGIATIEPNARGRLPFDAPNRFLAWGQWNAPLKVTVLPVLDVHTGFPYSLIDEDREFVGPRNVDRFNRFTSFDLQMTRPIRLPLPHENWKARVGFSVFNLFNHFNPRDVQNDIDSDRFGSYFNGVGRTFRGKFVLEF